MILKTALLPAALTGTFCAVFAVVIDATTNMLDTVPVIALAFVSGFLGSLFSRFVLGRGGSR